MLKYACETLHVKAFGSVHKLQTEFDQDFSNISSFVFFFISSLSQMKQTQRHRDHL